MIIIGVTGGSGSGKSTVVKQILKSHPKSVYITQDSYYKSASYINNDNITAYNFDQPDAFDMDKLYADINDLRNGKAINMPQYDFVHHCRMEETVLVQPSDIIILDGLMVMYEEKIRSLLDLKLFVDTPSDIRFIRRLQRDIIERGRTVESVIEQYVNVVRPGHINYIEPCKKYCDLIIPEGGYNKKAMTVLIKYLETIINQNL